jgi:hypothetical protein
MKTEMRTEWATGGSFTPSTVLHKLFFIGVNGFATDHGIHRAMHTDVNDIGNERLKQVTPIMIDEASETVILPLYVAYAHHRENVWTITRHHVGRGRASGGESLEPRRCAIHDDVGSVGLQR